MVGKQRADDFAARLDAARWKKNKVERAARPGRGKGVHARPGMQRVVAVAREVSEQRGGGIGDMRRVVEIATKDGRHVPVGMAVALLLFQVVGELPELEKPPFARTEVKMEVHDGHTAALNVDLGKKKTFLADATLAESDGLPSENRMARQQGIAIIEVKSAVMAVVDAEDRMGEPGVLAQKLEMVKAASPTGIFIDLLERDDVGLQPTDQMRDFLQARLEPATRSKAGDGHEATTMGDVEGNNAKARHTIRTTNK